MPTSCPHESCGTPLWPTSFNLVRGPERKTVLKSNNVVVPHRLGHRLASHLEMEGRKEQVANGLLLVFHQTPVLANTHRSARAVASVNKEELLHQLHSLRVPLVHE